LENTIILASASPRRKEILERMGLPFIVQPADIDETVMNVDPAGAVKELAVKKVMSACEKNNSSDERWYLAADTMVIIDNRMLGKPSCEKEAEEFLKILSGQRHDVFTALAFYDYKKKILTSASENSSVFFSKLSDKDIGWYLKTEEWKDAAGGYRIQEKGEYLIDRIEGSYSNIMGLPIRLFFSILLSAGYPV
jgi:septum formation protein